MRQSACLVFNPVMVDDYAAFFNCTPVGRASRLYDGPDIKLFILVAWGRSFLSVAWPTLVQLVFFFSFASSFSKLFGAQGFYHIWAWSSWLCVLHYLQIHWSPLPIDASYIKFGFDWPSGFRGDL